MKTTAYDTAAILRQNVADLEKQLQQQRERHSAATARLRDQIERVTSEWERAEAELKEMLEQKPVAWCDPVEFADDPWSFQGFRIRTKNYQTMPLYTSPIPAPAVPEEWREVMAGLIAIAEKKGKKQGSPNHCHQRPGIWDDDNGPVLSGKPCTECAMYDKARALLQSGGGK